MTYINILIYIIKIKNYIYILKLYKVIIYNMMFLNSHPIRYWTDEYLEYLKLSKF